MVKRSRLFTSPIVVMGVGVVLVVLSEYFTIIHFNVPVIGTLFYWVLLTATLATIAGVTLHRLHREEDRLLVSTFVVGLTIGLLVAIVKVVLYQELWTAFNLFAEPMRTALYGLVIGWLFLVRARSAVSRAFSN